MRQTPRPGLGGIQADELICSGKEARLIRYIRNLKYGEVTVVVKDGEPVGLNKVIEDVKL